MRKQTKAVACGSTGMADALAAALNRNVVIYGGGIQSGRHAAQNLPRINRLVRQGEAPTEAWVDEVSEIPQEVFDKLSKRPRAAGIFISEGAPTPLEEKRKREEQAAKIKKLSAIIKRAEPRLLMELLQTFGSIEGLNAAKQADLIKRLEHIRKEYGL